MKRINRLFVVLVSVLVLVLNLSPVQTARAEENREIFTDLGEADEFLVCIEWENSRPSITFESPSGVLYDAFTEGEGVHFSISGTTCYYYLENAEKGTWYVIYDKLDNADIYITPEKVTSPFVVKEVTVQNVAGAYADVSFLVEYGSETEINYQISISADGKNAGKELASGFCTTNQKVETRVDLSQVRSYGNYQIYVNAYFTEDGVDIFDGAFSEPFAYTSQNQAEFTTPVSLEITPEDYTARIGWEPKYGYTYIVSLFEDNEPEPSSFGEINDTSVDSYDFNYRPTSKTIEVCIAEKSGNQNYSNEKVLRCDVSQLPKIVFEEADVTNRDAVRVHYSGFPNGRKVVVQSNEKSQEIILSSAKEGNLDVEIYDDYNEVKFLFAYSDEITVVYEKTIYRDCIPPRIYMTEDYSNVVSKNNSFTLLGTLTGADRLEIAGTEVPFDDDGKFSYTVALNDGENIVYVDAFDRLGNGARYTAVITFPANKSNTLTGTTDDDNDGSDTDSFAKKITPKALLPGIIAGVIGLIVVILLLVLPKKNKKNGWLSAIRKIFGWVLGMGILCEVFFFVKWYVIHKQNDSTKFIDQAAKSLKSAGQLLKEEQEWKKCMLYCGIVILVSCIGFVVSLVLPVNRSVSKTDEGSEKDSNKQ